MLFVFTFWRFDFDWGSTCDYILTTDRLGSVSQIGDKVVIT